MRKMIKSLPADSNGNVIEETLSQLLLNWCDIFFKKICSQQANSAVNVESNSTGTDYGKWIVHIKCSHIADGETIS